MAEIKATTTEKVYTLRRFLGLNQNPDGDTKLKYGEAAVMRNFCVTRDGNLRKRGGTHTVLTISEGNPVVAMWSGMINKRHELLAAAGGKLWRLWNDDTGEFELTEIGDVDTSASVHMFGFSEIVYILDGKKLRSFDGSSLVEPEGYRPLISVGIPPDGGGEILEQINKLNGKRRAWLSPDGVGTKFLLPEFNLSSFDYAISTKDGSTVAASSYTVDLAEGSITFNDPPERGVNMIEVGWSVETDFRDTVCAMRYSELYNGTQDSRVFIYGDGSHKAFYSGVDYDGRPRADYFPDLNELAVGDANTPITGLIRHHSKMIAFKHNSTWSVQFGLTTLSGGETIPGFYVTPVNKAIGNVALGQVQLVLNDPRTLFGKDLYEWKSVSTFGSELSNDERSATRISDRIHASLELFTTEDCLCFDDNYHQEYFICHGDRMLVQNYAVDAWYEYTGLNASSMISFLNETYIGTADGKFDCFNERYISDNNDPIEAYWESGSMSFGQDYMRKSSAQLWIGTKPQSSGEIDVTIQTDRKSEYAEKIVESSLASFKRCNFANFSFNTNRKPQMKRLKIKAKKFVFYKLILRNYSASTTATVLAADIRVRFSGYAK